MFYQFMLPFDEGSKTNAAARFYNASSQPVTLTLHLNDVEGKPLATKELSPNSRRASRHRDSDRVFRVRARHQRIGDGLFGEPG